MKPSRSLHPQAHPSHKRATAVTALIAIFTTVCVARAEPREGGDAKVFDGRKYLRLELKRRMRYDVTVSPPVGKDRKATATNQVAEKVELSGKTYFKVTTTISGVPFIPDQSVYYRAAPDGVYQVLPGDEKSPEWLYLPAKIKIGDHWGAETPSGDFQFSAVGLEDVQTPAGKYPRCLKLKVTMKKSLVTNTQNQWLAPGVGVVKQTDSNPVFSSTTLLEQVTGEREQGKANRARAW